MRDSSSHERDRSVIGKVNRACHPAVFSGKLPSMEAENVARNLCCPRNLDATKFEIMKFLKFTVFAAMLSIQVAAAQDNTTTSRDAAADRRN